MAMRMKLNNPSAASMMRYDGFKGVLTLILILLMGHGYASGANLTEKPAVSIVVKETATVRGDAIRLEEIALIHSSAPSVAEKLGKIEIGESPKPGFEKRITGRWLQTLVSPENIDYGNVRFSTPDTITVKRDSQEVPEAQLFKLFQSYVDGRNPDGEVIVSQFKVRGTNLFPLGSIELTPVPENKTSLGVVTLSVNVMIDEKAYGALVLSGKTDIYKNVALAKTFIKRGSILSTEDVRLHAINISKAPPDVITRLEDVSGKLVTTNVREGVFLRKKILEAPPVVEKGDKVKLVARRGTLTIVAMGIAKAGGAEGDQIQVKNVSSGKMVVGRVKDASTVDVLF